MDLTLHHRQFFAILRLAVGGATDDVLTEHAISWDAIYQTASEQSLIGVTFRGIERLLSQQRTIGGKAVSGPVAWGMPMALFMDWCGQTEVVRSQNKIVDEASRKVLAEMESLGARAILLKGQANNALYHITGRDDADLRGLRMPGDIDVWAVRGSDLEQSRKVMAAITFGKMPDAGIQPHNMDYPPTDGIPVELHFTPSTVFSPLRNHRVQRYFEEVLPRCTHRLPLDVDTIFQLMHIRRHLIAEGIGLRQAMDLYFVLQTYTDTKEAEDLTPTLQRLGLHSFARAMMWVLGTIFEGTGDRPATWMIGEPDERRGRFVLQEMMRGGNFGHHDTEFTVPDGTKAGNLLAYTRHAYRCVRWFPEESLCNPLYRIYTGLWRKKNNY